MPTKIEWCDESWSPITGCTPISDGCKNCYAKRMAQRLKGRFGYPKDDPFKVTTHLDKLHQPLTWKKPRRIFVVSMGDLFHEDVDSGRVAAIFGIMAFSPQHTFMVLTKRPERMKRFFSYFHEGEYSRNLEWWKNEACQRLTLSEKGKSYVHGIRLREKEKIMPLPNLWLGVTAENQDRADERIPILLQIPAAKHFVSIEPMLGMVELASEGYLPFENEQGTITPGLDLIIAGGESGPGARPAHPDWFRRVRDDCAAAGVSFFFKQWGEWAPSKKDKRINTYGAFRSGDDVFIDSSEFTFEFGGHPGLTNQMAYRVGKKAAGRELDGVIHDGWPEGDAEKG